MGVRARGEDVQSCYTICVKYLITIINSIDLDILPVNYLYNRICLNSSSYQCYRAIEHNKQDEVKVVTWVVDRSWQPSCLYWPIRILMSGKWTKLIL